MSVLNSTILTSVAGENNQVVAGIVGVVAILGTTAICYALNSKDKEHEFPKLHGVQLYHAWNFFRRRYDFLVSNHEQNLGKGFSFNILHHTVVALTGDDARQVFFSSPHLNFSQGYRILSGTAPRLSDVGIAAAESEEGNVARLNKKLSKVLSRARIQDILPTMVQDVIRKADKWGNDGKTIRIELFAEMYDFVFATTARLITCDDLVKNEADLKRVGDLFLTILTGSTPTSLVLPWFPNPASKIRNQATVELYSILCTYVEARRHAELTNDAIDFLIADGETTQDIVKFVLKALFAGTANTGSILYWALIDLAIHSEWREKCKKEIQDFISHHLGDSHSATLYEKLGAIPLSVWEDELPILEACNRESHRIAVSGVSLRRNLREDIEIGGRAIKRGDFLAYYSGEVHLNPEYYPEPYMYDPGRWLRPDPVPNAPFPFLGWGVGRHPCAGMKVAKLEMKLIMATFLTGYEFNLVDKDGKFPNSLPIPDRNSIHQIPPLGAPYYFDFKKVVQ